MSFGSAFCLTLLTDDPLLARRADRAGVQRIGVDLETLGKAERQAGHDTRLSRHDWDGLARVGAVLERAELFVRLNPLHEGSADEVERALALGAEIVMLPQFRGADELTRFLALVRGRARVQPLVETVAALDGLASILAVPGCDEVMIGLNDLRLEMRQPNHFALLASPRLAHAAQMVRTAGKRLSIGGVGRAGDRALPVPADLVQAQYPRLGATGAWLARSFFNGMPADWDLAEAIAALRGALDGWGGASPEALERARLELESLSR
jgi:citrate lyase beta subunit